MLSAAGCFDAAAFFRCKFVIAGSQGGVRIAWAGILCEQCFIAWCATCAVAVVCLAAWFGISHLLKRFQFIGYNHSEK